MEYLMGMPERFAQDLTERLGSYLCHGTRQGRIVANPALSGVVTIWVSFYYNINNQCFYTGQKEY